MAGGPISPGSVYLGGAGGLLFPNFYAGGGGNVASHDEGIGVVASLSTDAVAELRFPMPPTIPSGSLKLMVRGMSSTNAGKAIFTVIDGSCGSGSSPSAAALSTEAQSTATFATADAYLDTKVTLAATPSGNDDLIVGLKFQGSGWTLAAGATFQVWALWE